MLKPNPKVGIISKPYGFAVIVYAQQISSPLFSLSFHFRNESQESVAQATHLSCRFWYFSGNHHNGGHCSCTEQTSTSEIQGMKACLDSYVGYQLFIYHSELMHGSFHEIHTQVHIYSIYS